MNKEVANKEVRTKKKDRKNVPVAVVHVQASFNNTIVTVTDLKGNVITWCAAGFQFKGSRKSTPYAAQLTAEHAVKAAKEHGVKTVSIILKGSGTGRESAVRAVMGADVNITSIKDVTPIAHNGCRPRKRRRV